jgi:carboxyl-terminal processing protease
MKNNNISSLVIDLRNNPGGLLDQVIEIADLFLKKYNTIIIVKSNDGLEHKIYSETKDIYAFERIFILQNEGSASASEILAIAMKENNLAKIIGTKSFGKGLIQTILPLESGGHVKLTISEYLSPMGNKIDAVGITPDMEVAKKDILNFYEHEKAKMKDFAANKAKMPAKTLINREDPFIKTLLDLL